jgi:N-acetylneuraminate synthase
MKICEYDIEMGSKPFIIAEMSGNHNGDINRALALVDAAADAGAHAVKLQTYTADTMTLNVDKPEFYIDDPKSLWAGRHLYELYEEAHTPWEWHEPIMKRARERGIICFSTPFDVTAVDFLEELNVPCYKIASFENTDTNLIKKVAATGKPIIISTGMANLSDLELMVNTMRDNGCNEFALLKCASAYPAPYASCNLKTIPHMADMFKCPVGLSDHTLGTAVPIAAVALGAPVIEKHFTLSKNDGGVDSVFSLDKNELKELVYKTEQAWESLGRVEYLTDQVEVQSQKFRRSLYFTKDIEKGERITKEHVRVIRPGFGLEPRYYERVIDSKATRSGAIVYVKYFLSLFNDGLFFIRSFFSCFFIKPCSIALTASRVDFGITKLFSSLIFI